RLAELETVFEQVHIYDEMTAAQQQAQREHHELDRTIKLRAYMPAMMAKAGCFVELNYRGALEIEYGRVKPAQKEQAAKVEKEEKRETAKAEAKTAKAEGKPAPESPTVLSNALKQRLEMWLVAATRDAIAGEPLLVNSPLFEILAK